MPLQHMEPMQHCHANGGHIWDHVDFEDCLPTTAAECLVQSHKLEPVGSEVHDQIELCARFNFRGWPPASLPWLHDLDVC